MATSNSPAEQLITDNIGIWTSAIKKRGSQGRGSSKKIELHGIKKLRELILELAVRGLLVPQDPNDEPASVLLEKIAAEKEQLIKDGKIKKQKALPEISEDEKPFELPKGWKWTRIPAIGHDWGQVKPDQAFTYIDVGSINKELGLVQNPNILSEENAPSRARKIVKEGTVIYSTIRPYLLNIAVINSEINPMPIASTAFAIIHPYSGISSSFIYRYLRSPIFINYVESVQTGVAYPAINEKQFSLGLFPLPPEAEQTRIVAKVDELMALCDQLEQQTESSLSAHQTLVETLLNTLLNADQNSFDPAWERIAQHFDVLFTTEHSIDQLKQTILQLAVMGKLVPQDPNDEPVDNLLDRVIKHRAVRVKNKEIQKPKDVTYPIPLGIKVPNSWSIIILNDLAFVTKLAGFEYSKYINLEDDGEVPVIRAQNVRPFNPSFSNLKYIDMETSKALPRSSLDRPALLVTFIGAGIGDVCVLDENRRWHLAPNVAKVEPFSDLNLRFLNIFMSSPEGRKELFKSMKSTAQPSLSMTTLREVWCPIPPVEEQSRIVSKVDELMNLCDTLKERVRKSQTTQLHLADAMAEQALNS